MDTAVFSALLPEASSTARTEISQTLLRFGDGALKFAALNGVTIRVLDRGERYANASAALARLGIDVDAWPTPPAGLFVVEERSVILRSCSPMTVAHEFSHALDCALGDGVYISGIDSHIRAAFAGARTFVTPYAAAGLDEYFAEACRAYVEANDVASAWPAVSRERLAAIDPAMFEIVDAIFARFASAGIEALDICVLRRLSKLDEEQARRSALWPTAA